MRTCLPGRPPAAPASAHACEPVRDVWGMRDGTLLWCVTCRWCGRSMADWEENQQ